MTPHILKFDATNMQKVKGELILSGEIERMFEFLKGLGLPVFAIAFRRQIEVQNRLIVWWEGLLVC